ncbi:unnamed protein product [Ilex paraguariensis]|uniref:Threonylcarbamoyl-AMP synthase n=1 Tax=Ilex paraguariensis TaxID=185542 RepID=A0ABC8RXF4_9AQUA
MKYAHDVVDKRARVYGVLEQIEGLNFFDRTRVGQMIVNDQKRVNYFFSLPDTAKPYWLQMLLGGVPKIGFVNLLQRRRGFRGGMAKKMAWSLEKCEVNGETKLGLVQPATEEYAEEAIEALKAGKVMAVPTDTLYGFVCDAWATLTLVLLKIYSSDSLFWCWAYCTSTEAVNRIYEIKGRKHMSPLAICVGDVQDIQCFAITDHLPCGLLDCLLPGPVTVVLRRGVRVPDCNFIRVIARGSGTAPALTSANLSGKPSSVDIKDFENLWEHCVYIYDEGMLPLGRAGSTIVDFSKLGKYKILRPGRVIARGSGTAPALTSANLSGKPSSVDIKDFENLWEHCVYIYDEGMLPLGRAGSTIVDFSKLGKYKILRPGR